MSGRDKVFYVWDTATWEERVRVKCPFLSAFALNPARSIVAGVVWKQQHVKFIDLNTGQVTCKYQWKLGKLVSVAFSPDGTLAAAGAANGKIVVWDVDE